MGAQAILSQVAWFEAGVPGSTAAALSSTGVSERRYDDEMEPLERLR